jgi:hypothetical protein
VNEAQGCWLRLAALGIKKRIDGPGKGDADPEMAVNAMTGDWVGAASGGFCQSIPTGCQFRPTVD